jgi:hypothetical protein
VATAVVLAVILFTYATSVFILSPRYSNRFLPYRLTLTLLWAVGLGLVVLYAQRHGLAWGGVVALWLLPSNLLLLLMLQVGECTPDLTSRRVLGKVPRSFVGRLVCFPFYSGGANGMVWALGLLALGYGVLEFVGRSARGHWRSDVFLVTFTYAACYILTAGLVSRRFSEPARQGAAAPWLISLYFFAAAAMVPLFLDLLDENRKIVYDPDVEHGNVFCMFRGQREYVGTHLAVAIPWLILLLILNGPRLVSAFQRFRRPPEPATLKDVLGDDAKVEAFEA